MTCAPDPLTPPALCRRSSLSLGSQWLQRQLPGAPLTYPVSSQLCLLTMSAPTQAFLQQV